MIGNISLPQNWFSLLLICFGLVIVGNGLLACSLKNYYRNRPAGRLTHSQLRVRQGNAAFEHRFNVFGHTLALGLFRFRLYAAACLVWIVLVLLASFGIIHI
jgi:hypothetical protein